MSLQLLVVRHAIAFERNAKRWPDDTQRPLTAEGITRARQAAAGLRRIAGKPSLVFTSPLVRARDTAAIFAQAAGWPQAVECDALSPGGSPEAVLEALRRQRPSAARAAIVGHQPDLGLFLATCLRGGARAEAFEVKKCAIACLQFEGSPRAGGAALAWLLAPRILRQLR